MHALNMDRLTTLLVCDMRTFLGGRLSSHPGTFISYFTDYEHQRRALLKKHGIDLEDQSFVRRKTMRRQDIDALVAQRWKEEGDGYLTWKDKRRKMAFSVCG